jgi:hypothetical protein
MSAVLKPYENNSERRSHLQRSHLQSVSRSVAADLTGGKKSLTGIRSRIDRIDALARHDPSSQQTSSVQPLLDSSSLPEWLRHLLMIQRGSSIVALAVVVGVLATYGWTVYLQRSWNREYQSLEVLRQQERQLTTASETLKYQLAELSEQPEAGLVLPNSEQILFLTPSTPTREAVMHPPRAIAERDAKLQDIQRGPIGY